MWLIDVLVKQLIFWGTFLILLFSSFFILLQKDLQLLVTFHTVFRNTCVGNKLGSDHWILPLRLYAVWLPLDIPASALADEIFSIFADGIMLLGAGRSELVDGQLFFEATVHSVK